jgi:hypothetical protein
MPRRNCNRSSTRLLSAQRSCRGVPYCIGAQHVHVKPQHTCECVRGLNKPTRPRQVQYASLRG